jgi:hypothetical protein
LQIPQPRLASWNKAEHPDQVRLKAYLEELDSIVQAGLAGMDGNLAMELTVGLPRRQLTVDRDLDNYLLPVANRLSRHRFCAVFGTKAVQNESVLRCGPTSPIGPGPDPSLELRVSGSYEHRAWKERIHRACAAVRPNMPPGVPVALDVAFELAPRRNWTSLWKPAIDALGPLLGTPRADRPFAPDDGRITELGLHRTWNSHIGHDVRLAYWWRISDMAPALVEDARTSRRISPIRRLFGRSS